MKTIILILFLAVTGFAQKDFIVVFHEPTESTFFSEKKIKIKKKFNRVLNGYVAEMNDEQLDRVKKDKKVNYIEPDSTVVVPQTNVWGLDRIDQQYLPLNGTYNIVQTGSGIDAYIIDTGINTRHADFGGRASVALDLINDGNEDCNGHGTHVAGTVGGTTYGVAKQVNLKSLRVMTCTGSGSVSSMIAAVDWVAVNKTRPSVVNISLVVSTVSQAFNTAVDNLSSMGVPVVVAAANYGLDACNFSPGSAASAITVGATDSLDGFASYSNRGACVDVSAPGSGIVSAAHYDNISSRTLSGTSMAAPHVTGVVALYLEQNPDADPTNVKNTIKYAATSGVITNIPPDTINNIVYTGFILGCNQDLYYNKLTGTLDYYDINDVSNMIGVVSTGFILTLEKKQGKTWKAVAESDQIYYSTKSGTYRWKVSGNGIYRACLSD